MNTWEKTVMSLDDAKVLYDDGSIGSIKNMLQHQVRIFFKVGRIEGMLEVVRFAIEHGHSSRDTWHWEIDRDEWHSYLKEIFKDNPEILKELGLQ